MEDYKKMLVLFIVKHDGMNILVPNLDSLKRMRSLFGAGLQVETIFSYDRDFTERIEKLSLEPLKVSDPV